MTEERFQKRYVEKDNKVFDTWKNIPISRELDRYSLSHIISHLNGLGEIIDIKIEQGRYCIKKYKELEEENEKLKKENYELHKRLGDFEPFERYMKEITSKTSVNDIIGLVKTDEPTNSVELKKELYK